MAISLVKTARSQTNGASTTATFSSAPTSGNLLIAFAYTNGAMTNLNVTGFTLVSRINYSGTAQSIGVFAKISNGTETSVTSTGVSICRLQISEWSGLDNPYATDGSNSGTQNTTTSISTGSITTTNADDLIVAVGGISTGGTITGSWSNSFSALLQDVILPRLFSAYRIVSATGSYSTTGTLRGTNTNMGAIIVAFKSTTAPTGRIKVKIGGVFVSKPVKVKIGGTFIEKPVKVKIGGTFV